MSAASLKIRIPEHLPEPERKVLMEIAQGKSCKMMTIPGVKRSRVGDKMAECYRSKLQHRVDLYSVAALTKLAIRIGLAEIDV